MKVKKKLTSLILAGIMAVMSCGSLATSAEEEKKLPDPNGDGTLNISDSVLIMQYLSGAYAPTDIKELDVDRNGVVSYMDAKRIELYTARLESGLVEVPSYKDNSIADTITNEARYYNVYDAKTANMIYQYRLDPVPNNQPKADGVFDKDDRKPDPNCNGVVHINGIGTGFIVDDHVIATAAHCVNGKKINKVSVLNNSGSVVLNATPVEYHIPVNYPSIDGYDYALISVKEDLSSYPHFEIGVALDNVAGANAKISGFPGIVNGSIVNDSNKHVIY
ncbi:MAG: trypsin-like peptidase domain-containing protein, partial [Ruminococcus sp.]|nr:trypsin-like peptidase domain-containing protein [Ruminococcus sp.]